MNIEIEIYDLGTDSTKEEILTDLSNMFRTFGLSGIIQTTNKGEKTLLKEGDSTIIRNAQAIQEVTMVTDLPDEVLKECANVGAIFDVFYKNNKRAIIPVSLTVLKQYRRPDNSIDVLALAQETFKYEEDYDTREQKLATVADGQLYEIPSKSHIRNFRIRENGKVSLSEK